MESEISEFYALGEEQGRLAGPGWLEFERTKELLQRHLPKPPASVIDIGGGPGAYAVWLAEAGYEVQLIDPVPLHIEQAEAVAQAATPRFIVKQGDARALAEPDGSFDAVLLLGPLYHLTERDDRLLALSEARRVLRPDGLLAAAAVSRFASVFDGLTRGLLFDAGFAEIVEADLGSGQHRNPDSLEYGFTTAFFHHPADLTAEVTEAGFAVDAIYGVEGPASWFRASAPVEGSPERERLKWVARAVEQEPTLLGASAHLLAIARKQP